MGAYFVYGFAAFILFTTLPALIRGISLLLGTNPHGEVRDSPWPWVIPGIYGLLQAIILVGVYHFEYLSAWWSIIVIGFSTLPLSIYRHSNAWRKS